MEVFDFRDGYFPEAFRAIKEVFRGLPDSIDPHVIFTHWGRDLHQDHPLISDLTGQAFRDPLILQYEMLKYDGDLGAPNVYVPVGREAADRMVEYLLKAFASQQGKYWFTRDTFEALMRVRGIESRSASGFAEAFYGDNRARVGRSGVTRSPVTEERLQAS